MGKHHEIVLKYAPRIFFDESEPFSLAGIGTSVLTCDGKSPSFRRDLKLSKHVEAVVEYAYFWDYDIEHLYDLEHIWVYLSAGGEVVDAEASFHGRYLKAMLPCVQPALEGTHLNVYCQPGKHAFLPNGEWFRLLPDWQSCCTETAGSGGLLVNEMFSHCFSADKEMNLAVKQYIYNHFAFSPTLRFLPTQPEKHLYMPWEKLRETIPQRIKAQLALII